MASTSGIQSFRSDIDWSLCCLCQLDTPATLACPADSKKANAGVGYNTLSNNLKGFKELGETNLKVLRLDEGDGLEAILVANRARFHKTCFDKYSAMKLDRARKRRSTEVEAEVAEEEGESIVKRTRSTADSTHIMKEERCFELSTIEDLTQASTLGLDANVPECAVNLNDTKLLAKLSSGDLIALEAKYHKKCLASLYNRLRSYNRKQRRNSQDVKDNSQIKSAVLAELVSYIYDKRDEEEDSPVFKLKDIVKLY